MRREGQRAGPAGLLYGCLWMAKPELTSSGPEEDAITCFVDAGGNRVEGFLLDEVSSGRHRYGYGSCFNGSSEALARAGWGLAEVNDEGGLIKAAYGNIPRAAQQSASMGDHFMLVRASMLKAQGLPLHVDCAALVSGGNAGPRARGPRQPMAG